MSSAQALSQAFKKNGLIEVEATVREAMLSAAADLGLGTFVVACDKARSRSAVLRAIVKAVDYHEFLGSDLEALYECLTECLFEEKQGLYLWLDKLHTGDPILGEHAQAILATFDEAAAHATDEGKVFCYSVEHAGPHADPVEAQTSHTEGRRSLIDIDDFDEAEDYDSYEDIDDTEDDI